MNDARTIDALESIAASLAVIAGDITARQAHDAAALRSQLAYLRIERENADRRFEVSDTRLLRDGRQASEDERAWNQRNEDALNQADAALQAFLAAHPELAEMRV